MSITADISSKMVEAVVESNITEIEWGGQKVGIKHLIDLPLTHDIIDKVIEYCFANEGKYDPRSKTFMERLAVVMAYTDIDVPDNVAEQYAFIYGTDIYRQVIAYASSDQLADIFDSIEELIEIRVKSKEDALVSIFTQIYAELNAVVGNLGTVYKEMKGENVAEFIKAVTESKLDEGKLVKAMSQSKE